MTIASYDISKKTTFPGSKPQLKERIQKQLQRTDSAEKSTLKHIDP
jgi:hypothetical protein